MARNMSFSATIQQMRDQTKIVTRRQGWRNLKPGDILCAVEKGMGLKKGESVTRIGMIRVLSVSREPVSAATDEDVRREGFPGRDAIWFVSLYCAMNRCKPDDLCTRIEFEHVLEAE